MSDERPILLEGQWWIAVLAVAFLIWFFFGGGVQWVLTLLA